MQKISIIKKFIKALNTSECASDIEGSQYLTRNKITSPLVIQALKNKKNYNKIRNAKTWSVMPDMRQRCQSNKINDARRRYNLLVEENKHERENVLKLSECKISKSSLKQMANISEKKHKAHTFNASTDQKYQIYKYVMK